MFNKKSLIILSLAFHFSIGIKSTDFCALKQKECKGYYNENQIYKIECNSIKCHGAFRHNCVSNICSNKVTECSKYNKMNTYFNILDTIRSIDTILYAKNLNQTKKIKLFNYNIKDCNNKIYKFKKNDFCINGKNCLVKRKIGNIYGFNYIYGKNEIFRGTECHCPSEQSFKCGKLCAIDSNACDYYRTKKNIKNFKNIKQCGNKNMTYFINFL